MRSGKKMFSLVLLSLLGFFSSGKNFINNSAAVINNAPITGVQIRRSGTAVNSGYFVVQMSQYSSISADTLVTNSSNFNTTDKIKVYLSKTDAGVYLSSFCESSWTQNKWVSSGLMFPVFDTAYETYNGQSVYKIVIEEGCELPCGSDTYVASSKYTFVNPNYGNSSFYTENFTFTQGINYAEPTNQMTGEISCIQFRGEESNVNERYIVLQNELYGNNSPSLKFDGSRYNTLSKIKVFLSDSDEGTLLSDIVTDTDWFSNQWSSQGLMMHIPADKYSTFNGSSVYKVVVESGCEFPVNDSIIYKTNKRISYQNTDYLNESKKFGAFYILPYPDDLVDFGECSIKDINFRSDDNCTSVLFLMKLDFNFSNYLIVDSWASRSLNYLDNILITVVDDQSQESEVTLREIFVGSITLYLYGEPNAIGTFITPGETYVCKHLKSVKIKKDTQIPAVFSDAYGYYTVKYETEFLNDDFGKSGSIDGQYDENQEQRIYEEWCNNWSKILTVTFNVEGLDIYIAPETFTRPYFMAFYSFEVDGFDLEITRDNGNKIYDGIFLDMNSGNYNLTFKYTKKESKKSGCNGSIIVNSLIISIFSMIGISLCLFAKREEISHE